MTSASALTVSTAHRPWLPRFGRAALYGAVFVSIVAMIFPIVWMLVTSFKPPGELFVTPPTWIPREPTLDGYKVALSPAILRALLNSIVIAAGAAILACAAGSMFAYGIARTHFRGRGLMMTMTLATLGLPIPLLMITLYVLFARLQLLDTYYGMILSHAAITMPVVIWILKDFFDALPIEVEEAAYVDGAGLFYTFWRIVVPMAAPGLAASAIFVFVTSWNEFVFGLTFTSSEGMRPLPAMISLLFLGEFQYRWGDAMAVAVLVTLPIMLLFLMFQRYFVQGITAGAVKS